MFQQNQLEDVRTNITVWSTSLAMQVIKLKKLNHVLDEEYQIHSYFWRVYQKSTAVLWSKSRLTEETSSTLITMDEIKKKA